MRTSTRVIVTLAVAIATAPAFATMASAQDASAQAVYKDIEQTLGSVPGFLRQVPKAASPGRGAR